MRLKGRVKSETIDNYQEEQMKEVIHIIGLLAVCFIVAVVWFIILLAKFIIIVLAVGAGVFSLLKLLELAGFII